MNERVGLERAVLAAQVRFRDTARETAGIVPGSTHGVENEMSASAQAALFEEALLGASKAQFSEIKTVAK